MPHFLYGAFAMAGYMGEVFRTTINEYYIASPEVVCDIKTARSFAVKEQSLLAALADEYGTDCAMFVTERDAAIGSRNGAIDQFPRVKFYFKDGTQPAGWQKPAGRIFSMSGTLSDKDTEEKLHLFVPPQATAEFEQISNKVDLFCARAAAFLGTSEYQPGNVKGEADERFGWEHSVWREKYGFEPRKDMGLKKNPVLNHAPVLYPVGDNDFILGVSYWNEGDFSLPETLSGCQRIAEQDFKAVTDRDATNSEDRLQWLKQGQSARTFLERMTVKFKL